MLRAQKVIAKMCFVHLSGIYKIHFSISPILQYLLPTLTPICSLGSSEAQDTINYLTDDFRHSPEEGT